MGDSLNVSTSGSRDFFSIDGSYGEGGGSILRLSTAFSVLTQKPIRIYNIRKNRPNPGLRTQHLVGLKTLAELCYGKLSDVKVGTTELTFEPGKIKNRTLNINISTAGSIGLVLQAIQIACINSNCEIHLIINGGATFGKWAPTIPYLQNVTFKILEKMGFNTKIKITKEGFYPKGGARGEALIKSPKQISPINLEELGSIEEIYGVSVASNFLKRNNVAERQAEAAKNIIRKRLRTNCQIRKIYVDSFSPGSGICIWLKTDKGVILGSDKIGEKKIRAEIVGRKCAEFLVDTYKKGATCDTFLSDQLLPYMAMAQGSSKFKTTKLTNHAKTNIWLAQQFFKKNFQVNQKNDLIEVSCSNNS